ncbi:hypothetical protein BJY27_006761 [Streptomyces rapamycinicus]|uniref:Uncharacterized protein n=2 Tax=Streptomyces rapamycinicus TaxID=1226757 RepID=A0A3L8RG66_STRRN|nr:hypothetical protein [Streptomyces rapamycinicus]RLV78735.1 hypothetical protein D3C57_110160 [Streptomyces rapamycinicus NRRL 5491]
MGHRKATPAERAARAEQILRDAGYRPLIPYPGHASSPWAAVCTSCDTVRYPTVTEVLQDQCKHVRREQPPPPGRKSPGGLG